MTYFLTYLILKLDTMHDILNTFVAIGILFFGLLILYHLLINAYYTVVDINFKKILDIFREKKIKLIGIVWGLILLLEIVLPTTKQMISIIVIPKLLNNNHVQKISDNSLLILEKITDIKLKELIKQELIKK